MKYALDRICEIHGWTSFSPRTGRRFVTVQLHQRVIKLSSLQTVFGIRPRGGRHAAVGVQKNPETTDQQEHQKQQQEPHKTKRSALLCVRSPQEPRCGPGARDRSQRQQFILRQRAFTHLLSSKMKRVEKGERIDQISSRIAWCIQVKVSSAPHFISRCNRKFMHKKYYIQQRTSTSSNDFTQTLHCCLNGLQTDRKHALLWLIAHAASYSGVLTRRDNCRQEERKKSCYFQQERDRKCLSVNKEKDGTHKSGSIGISKHCGSIAAT